MRVKRNFFAFPGIHAVDVYNVLDKLFTACNSGKLIILVRFLYFHCHIQKCNEHQRFSVISMQSIQINTSHGDTDLSRYSIYSSYGTTFQSNAFSVCVDKHGFFTVFQPHQMDLYFHKFHRHK